MINAEYKELIDRKERLLQNFVGQNISPKIRFDGFKFDTDGTVSDLYSTPMRGHIVTSLISADADGNDSTEAWIEAGGPEAVVTWLDGLELLDGTTKYSA
jgi:hypothetical protein